MSVKHPTPFYGGALDGAHTTRRAAYLDDLGGTLPTATGDRAWTRTSTPKRYYARCSTGPGVYVYVHADAWEAWRSKASAA